MYLSTLRSYIEAMGGRLEILTRFPNRAMRINQLSGHSTRKNGRRGSATNFADALQTLNKNVAAPHGTYQGGRRVWQMKLTLWPLAWV